MKKYIVVGLTLLSMIFSGCIFDKGPKYRVYNHSIKEARVTNIQNVVIRATNNQQYAGALVGAILGYTFISTGPLTNFISQDLSTLAVTLFGGLAGTYVTQKYAASDAQELQLEFYSGGGAIIVVKGEKFRVGDKLSIETEGNNIVSLQMIGRATLDDQRYGAVY
jgi:outer membrane lipoprotein SlyB